MEFISSIIPTPCSRDAQRTSKMAAFSEDNIGVLKVICFCPNEHNNTIERGYIVGFSNFDFFWMSEVDLKHSREGCHLLERYEAEHFAKAQQSPDYRIIPCTKEKEHIFDYYVDGHLSMHDYWGEQHLEMTRRSSRTTIRRVGERHLSRVERIRFKCNHDEWFVPLCNVLRWQLYCAIVNGTDLTPFVIPVEGDVCMGNIRPLVFTITFDTRISCGREMYMLGVTPHRFPSHDQMKSASHVQVVAFPRMRETQNIILALADTIHELTRSGLELFPGKSRIRLRCEMRIAADLKAVWSMLGLASFLCPFSVLPALT
jgi:hypothetical protein